MDKIKAFWNKRVLPVKVTIASSATVLFFVLVALGMNALENWKEGAAGVALFVSIGLAWIVWAWWSVLWVTESNDNPQTGSPVR